MFGSMLLGSKCAQAVFKRNLTLRETPNQLIYNIISLNCTRYQLCIIGSVYISYNQRVFLGENYKVTQASLCL